MKDLVSINLPLYGLFNRDSLKLVLDAIKQQTYSPIEIILSEQNPKPTFKDEAMENSLKYCFSEILVVEGRPYFSPSRIRNKGLSISEGEFCYISDGDIIFKNTRYIESLVEMMKKDSEMVLVKPKMRRLVLECFEDFKHKAQREGIQKVVDSLYFPDEFTATTYERESDIIAIKFGPRKIYTTSKENYQKYIEDQSFKGFDPRIWSDVVHYGNILARLSHFISIGGYSERYLHWGYEDVDTHWKLGTLFDLQEIPKESDLEIIHLDHPKNYFSLEIGANNRLLYERRVIEGVEKAIRYDIRNNKIKFRK